MNLLVVCQYYKPEPFRISDICEALVQMGHQVTVVTGTPNYPMGEIYSGYENGQKMDEVIGGVKVHRCITAPRKTGTWNRLKNYFSYPRASKKYIKTLDDSFDVVFVNQLSPVMMADAGIWYQKRHNKKLVLYCLDLWPESLAAGGVQPGSLIYRLFLRISKRIYGAVDEILIPSMGFERYFRDVLGNDKPCTYLPQYAEEVFDAVPPIQPHDPPYHFVFAGNIGEMQSVETILAAAQQLQGDDRIRFHIVGDGSNLAACKRQAEGLPNVTFYGRRSVTDMSGFYAMADAMLVTLKDNPILATTLPGKVQSYMAAGRAVVGAIGGETPRVLLAADCGCCVEAEDAVGLAEKIRALADAPQSFIHYGSNAKAYYQAMFQKEKFMATLTAVLERHAGEK